MSRPNFVLIMSDDHAAHAVGAYGSEITSTPQIDRIAHDGIRFDHCFCTNALCAPSRASILTGTYSHVNGVRTLSTEFDAAQPTFPAMLQAAGYQTAVFGKWHLGHGPRSDPHGFDQWAVLPGQGDYHDPELIDPAGTRVHPGYVTDIITDLSLDFLRQRDPDRPFCLLVNHKAPHRPWEPDRAHARLFDDVEIPLPPTWDDDHDGHGAAARAARMTVRWDLPDEDLKEPVPDGLGQAALGAWKYQRYLKDYLRCIASVDDNVGRVLDHLDQAGLSEDTLVLYTSDQGFFLGDHGWYDKRFMYEESLRMPLLIRYPPMTRPGSRSEAMVLNVDFAQTVLELAGVAALPQMQGRSMVPLLTGGAPPPGWRTAMFYRYWEHDEAYHGVWSHLGIRTPDHKLVYYYADGLGVAGSASTQHPPEWELFDLRTDPAELVSVADDPARAALRAELENQLIGLMTDLGDALPPVWAKPLETA